MVRRCSFGLINGQVLTISSIAPDATLHTKEGVCIPAEFRQWCTATSLHRADHVVVAAERLTAKGAYVACSRGRHSRIMHTPGPFKGRVIGVGPSITILQTAGKVQLYGQVNGCPKSKSRIACKVIVCG